MPAALQSPADAEVLAATAALIAAGKDPFGDDDDDTPPAAEVAGDDDTTDGEPPTKVDPPADGAPKEDDAAKTDEKTDGELDPEALEALAADDEPAAAAPERRYNAGDPAKFADERKALLAEKATALKGLMDGTVEPEAYSAKEAEITEKLDALLVQRTLHEANVQSAQQSEASAIESLMERSKKANEIDYVADKKAQVQFDAALNMLAVDPDNAKMPYAQRVAEAHKTVMALRGLIKPAPAAAPAPAPAVARENGKGPVTLRDIPAAASPNAGGGLAEQMAALSGVAYQEAFDRLSPAQKAQLRGD